MTVQNKWNRNVYEVVEIDMNAHTVTLRRQDGSVFKIAHKEYLANYIKK